MRHASSNSGLAETGSAGVLSTDTKARNHISAVQWLASLTKLPVSLAVLKLLEERREPSLGLKQLDDHEALLKVIPEFKLGGGHMVTKILEGINTQRRSEGAACLNLRDATVGITLRHL
jgi:methyl acetate hydrolase